MGRGKYVLQSLEDLPVRGDGPAGEVGAGVDELPPRRQLLHGSCLSTKLRKGREDRGVPLLHLPARRGASAGRGGDGGSCLLSSLPLGSVFLPSLEGGLLKSGGPLSTMVQQNALHQAIKMGNARNRARPNLDKPEGSVQGGLGGQVDPHDPGGEMGQQLWSTSCNIGAPLRRALQTLRHLGGGIRRAVLGVVEAAVQIPRPRSRANEGPTPYKSQRGSHD